MKSSFQYLKWLFKKKHVAVLDDFFPNLLTGFRVAEYNWYLERFPKLTVYSTNPDFKTVHAAYAKRYPQYENRVKAYDASSLNECAFAYVNFLNNAHYFLDALSLHDTRFLMTLYPGGGFGLRELESDMKLARVLDSPLLCGIIATQSVTVDYLMAKNCSVPVHEIYGGAMNPVYFDEVTKDKKFLQKLGKPSICFVADRYMLHGENKGYPQFIETAELLIREFPDLQFTVVGSFDSEDYPLSDQIRMAISFKGLLFTTELKEFFLTQDIIISPNRPFLLTPGNFDGFPTACCMEASLCGVVVVCNDELKLNRYYNNGEDIVICEPLPEVIAKKVGELIRNPDLLRSIGACGQRVSRKVFDPIRQLGQRADLLANYTIENCANSGIRRPL